MAIRSNPFGEGMGCGIFRIMPGVSWNFSGGWGLIFGKALRGRYPDPFCEPREKLLWDSFKDFLQRIVPPREIRKEKSPSG